MGSEIIECVFLNEKGIIKVVFSLLSEIQAIIILTPATYAN